MTHARTDGRRTCRPSVPRPHALGTQPVWGLRAPPLQQSYWRAGELRSLAEHLARFESPPSSCPPTAPSYGSMLDPSEAEMVKIVKISAEGLQNAKGVLGVSCLATPLTIFDGFCIPEVRVSGNVIF